MAKCDLCGEEAGLLRKRHKNCDRTYQAGMEESLEFIAHNVFKSEDAEKIRDELKIIADRSLIKSHEEKSIVIKGWQRAVDTALDDGVLTEKEENSLTQFAEHLSLGQKELDGQGAWSRMVKAAIIREILEGKLPERVKISGEMPFNLQKNEKLIYVFPSTRYVEQRTRTHYEGGYQGMSVRVAKGMYYRFGGFRGNPVNTSVTVPVGEGPLGVTNKHLYFMCPAKSFRIKYDKIISFTPFSDGIGIQRDTQSAKPQIFITKDGWFTCNLISNLSKLGL